MNERKEINPHFYSLVLSHEAAAMQYMGKVAGGDGKLTRNLEMAKYAIDTLAVIRDKTKGNVTEDEKRLLEHVVYQLQLNFVEESKTPEEESESDTPETEQPATESESDKTETPPAD